MSDFSARNNYKNQITASELAKLYGLQVTHVVLISLLVLCFKW